MIINKDFKEFITLLNKNNVKYLVIGGYAVAMHGHPRYTKDLDVWILTTNENIIRLINSFNDFGFLSIGLTEKDFMKTGYVIQLGNPPNRIDIFTSADGVDFDNCFKSKIIINIEGVDINFIDLVNLKKNKLTTGRYQDLADLDNLK